MHSLHDFAEILERDAPLAAMTTIQVGGPARALYRPRSEGQLGRLVGCLRSGGEPFKILGGGSNLLIPDEGVGEAVIRLSGELDVIDFDYPYVDCGAGAALGRLVGECAKRGLSGLEPLAGIPGAVGGALIMNAGGPAGCIGDVLESVRVVTPDGSRTIAAEEIELGYRSSSLVGEVVASARLRLAAAEADWVTARTNGFLEKKRASQPLSAASAGCVFKNPPEGGPAGRLIDACGFKGRRIGGAEVSAVHANYIINTGDATARDVLALIDEVRSGVAGRFDVNLDLEIQLW